MNDFLVEPLKNWFGYTRRERRATFILLLIILCVLVLRYSVPGKDIIQGFSIINADSVLSGKQFTADRNADDDKSYRPVPVAGGPNISKVNARNIGQGKRLLDINTCDSADLERLPGIGPVLSVRIIKYRNLLGGFVRTAQLKEVYGLTPETFDLISGRIFADTLKIRKININTADYRQLLRFPYFEKYEIAAILKYRELMGKITGMNDLVNNKLIAAEKAGKVMPYLDFED